jgi:hypothetical protein
MKKKDEIANPLSEFERTLLWMAIRYACHRQTISCSMLPGDIIKNYYDRMSWDQRTFMAVDLQRELESSFTGYFGAKDIDHSGWMTFMRAMDRTRHIRVRNTINKEVCTAFYANGRFVPLDKYLEHPHAFWYIPVENIKLERSDTETRQQVWLNKMLEKHNINVDYCKWLLNGEIKNETTGEYEMWFRHYTHTTRERDEWKEWCWNFYRNNISNNKRASRNMFDREFGMVDLMWGLMVVD